MAGSRAPGRVDPPRSDLVAHFDLMPVGVIGFDVAGQIVYRNPATSRLLDADPEHDIVTSAATRLAMSLHGPTESVEAPERRPAKRSRSRKATAPDHTAGVVAPPSTAVSTTVGSYGLNGTLFAPGLLGQAAVAVVVLQRLSPAPLDDDTLRNRFWLTPREIQVTRLIARGEGNRAIADALALSYHTARRHAESVLLKLGVRSRGAAGSLLRGESELAKEKGAPA